MNVYHYRQWLESIGFEARVFQKKEEQQEQQQEEHLISLQTIATVLNTPVKQIKEIAESLAANHPTFLYNNGWLDEDDSLKA